jgi:HEAT repeat protein
MLKTRYFAILSLLLVTAPARAADKAPAEDKQQKPLAVLRSAAPPQDKAMACKQLAVYGRKEAVPALAALLADERLSSWARIALEVIPDPAADEALRQASGKLQGRLLVGVINSIGVRRDAQAVECLAARLKDADADVASAAAVALGRIGGPAAVKALEPALGSGPGAVGAGAARSGVAEGCILCAEKFLSGGNRQEAVRLFDLVRKADVSKQRILEATRGAILAREAAGVPLLVEQLKSPDKAAFAVGLRVARELAGREVTAALMAELDRTTPERQGLLILALADRGDTAVLGVVLQAANSGPDQARIAALRVLERLGNASCLSVLLEAAMETNSELSQTALAVLAGMPGKEVDDDLVARLAKAEGKARQVLIQLAGRRSIAAATPALLRAADDPDAPTRAAALTALGATVEFRDLPVLIARLVHPQNPEDAAAAQKALSAACQRMPDPEACAEKLVAAMSQAPVPAKCRFLEVLTAVGGAKALAAVGAAARDARAEIQDTASRLLGEWMNVDAAPVLLDLAKTAADEKYKVRALRGYIRLARQFTMPDADRARMCRTALETAERDAEKKLVLEVLERYPSGDTLQIALDAAKIPALKNDAAAIAMVIAQRVGGGADLQRVMTEMGQRRVRVEVLKAEYGADKTFKDVTDILRKYVHDFPVIILPVSDYNSAFGGDPVGGVPKQLKIQYKMNGKPGEASFPENAAIMLTMPK